MLSKVVSEICSHAQKGHAAPVHLRLIVLFDCGKCPKKSTEMIDFSGTSIRNYAR